MYICAVKQSSLYKGILQPIVIQLLKDNGRMYGFEITQKVKSLTRDQVKITEGALYPLLHKLEADGILESEQEYVENRMRKYYSLSTKGKRVSQHSFDEVLRLVTNLQNIFKLKLT